MRLFSTKALFAYNLEKGIMDEISQVSGNADDVHVLICAMLAIGPTFGGCFSCKATPISDATTMARTLLTRMHEQGGETYAHRSGKRNAT